MAEEANNVETLQQEKVMLQAELEKLANMVANLRQNQEGLKSHNEDLISQLNSATEGKLIYRKLLAIKKDLGAIGKNHDFTIGDRKQYSFRGIDDVVNNLFPLLNRHGVGIKTKVLQNAEEYKTNDKGKIVKNTRVIMEYTFFAEDGSEVSCQMPAEGTDNSDKGTNKALSAAFKYCLFQCFCIPTEVGVVEEGDFERVDVGSEEAPKQVAKSTVKKAAPRKASAKKTPSKASSFRKDKLKVVGGDDDLEEL